MGSSSRIWRRSSGTSEPDVWSVISCRNVVGLERSLLARNGNVVSEVSTFRVEYMGKSGDPCTELSILLICPRTVSLDGYIKCSSVFDTKSRPGVCGCTVFCSLEVSGAACILPLWKFRITCARAIFLASALVAPADADTSINLNPWALDLDSSVTDLIADSSSVSVVNWGVSLSYINPVIYSVNMQDLLFRRRSILTARDRIESLISSSFARSFLRSSFTMIFLIYLVFAFFEFCLKSRTLCHIKNFVLH